MTGYVLTYELQPEMLKRAMMSWAKPERTKAQKLRRAAGAAVGFVALVSLTVVLLRYDIVTFPLLFTGLVGFYAAIAIWAVTHSRSVGKLVGYSADALARQGPVTAEFRPSDVVFTSRISNSRMDWSCMDAVIALPDATVLRAGALVYPVPDAVLPTHTTPDQFRADLTRWIGEAR